MIKEKTNLKEEEEKTEESEEYKLKEKIYKLELKKLHLRYEIEQSYLIAGYGDINQTDGCNELNIANNFEDKLMKVESEMTDLLLGEYLKTDIFEKMEINGKIIGQGGWTYSEKKVRVHNENV